MKQSGRPREVEMIIAIPRERIDHPKPLNHASDGDLDRHKSLPSLNCPLNPLTNPSQTTRDEQSHSTLCKGIPSMTKEGTLAAHCPWRAIDYEMMSDRLWETPCSTAASRSSNRRLFPDPLISSHNLQHRFRDSQKELQVSTHF
jgi:hypothetical protein